MQANQIIKGEKVSVEWLMEEIEKMSFIETNYANRIVLVEDIKTAVQKHVAKADEWNSTK
jgi:hypothetical protein